MMLVSSLAVAEEICAEAIATDLVRNVVPVTASPRSSLHRTRVDKSNTKWLWRSQRFLSGSQPQWCPSTTNDRSRV